MTGRIFGTPMNVSAKLAAAIVLVLSVLCCAYAAQTISYTAKSGVPTECHAGGHWRVDANGKVWPVTIQFIARPKNGNVTTQVAAEQRPLRGEMKTVRLTRVIYQSRKGFVGEDTFTYRRITADPTDPNNGKEYTVAVTVR